MENLRPPPNPVIEKKQRKNISISIDTFNKLVGRKGDRSWNAYLCELLGYTHLAEKIEQLLVERVLVSKMIYKKPPPPPRMSEKEFGKAKMHTKSVHKSSKRAYLSELRGSLKRASQDGKFDINMILKRMSDEEFESMRLPMDSQK